MDLAPMMTFFQKTWVIPRAFLTEGTIPCYNNAWYWGQTPVLEQTGNG